MHGNWKEELLLFLQMYYTTPHSVTGKTPTELMFGRTIRSKLPSIEDIAFTPAPTEFRDRDKLLKLKGKDREDIRRKATSRNMSVGDTVLVQNLRPGDKFKLTYDPEPYTVMKRNGPSVIVKNQRSGKELERNVAHLKKLPAENSSSSDSDLSEGFRGFTDDAVSGQSVVEEAEKPVPPTQNQDQLVDDGFVNQSVDSCNDPRRTRRLSKRPARYLN